VLHLLTKRRQDLVAARTQTLNRLHRLLLDLVPGGAPRNLTANRAAALLAQVAPTGAPAVTRWQLATELVADVRGLEQRIAAVEARIKAAVPRPTPACCSCSGSGRCRRPPSWVRSATSVGSRPSITSPLIPIPPVGGLQRPGHPPAAVTGRGPQAESRLVHGGHGPDPPTQPQAGLLPA
jgi:hypothetical protein